MTPRPPAIGATIIVPEGAVTEQHRPARRHGGPIARQDIRRVASARELHEAAEMAERGDALPGTQAHADLQKAEGAGLFALALAIRDGIKAYAPAIRAAALAREQEDALRGALREHVAVTDLRTIERAKQKRNARAAKRQKREHEAAKRAQRA